MSEATTDRRCGACTQCCKVMAIAELEKPMGVWCPHAKPGVGCAIHGHHPASCRGFQCQWILDPTLPPKFRPDRTKVVLTSDEDGRRLVANCDVSNPLAWRREPIYGLLKAKARATWAHGHRVIAKAGKHVWLIAPAQDVDVGEIEDRVPFQIDEGPDGVHVTLLPPIAEDEDVQSALTAMRDERLGRRSPT